MCKTIETKLYKTVVQQNTTYTQKTILVGETSAGWEIDTTGLITLHNLGLIIYLTFSDSTGEAF